jgi:hypothetical protein
MQFPIPRQEFVDPVDRVLGDAGEDIGQPSLRIGTGHEIWLTPRPAASIRPP